MHRRRKGEPINRHVSHRGYSSSCACFLVVTYRDSIVLETLAEDTGNGILVLLLNNRGGGSEDTESGLALVSLSGQRKLEQRVKQLGPRVV